ncbi:MAG TPA: AAA domain-containing protein [Anaerolineae bacterium]|nr:AAA domain-containing protein [Anaerolineae bacterium]
MMAEQLFIDYLPRRVSKGRILRLLIEEGKVRKEDVGRIVLTGRQAVVELPAGDLGRVVKALDGATVQGERVQVWGIKGSGKEDSFLGQMRRWLARDAETADKQMMAERGQAGAREKEGLQLTGLVIRDEQIGLGGRLLLTLGKRNRTVDLPWTQLTPGTPILLTTEGAAEGAVNGVVTQLRRQEIEIALGNDEEIDWGAEAFQLDLAMNQAGYERQLRALARAEAASNDRLAVLRGVLLGEGAPMWGPETSINYRNEGLNEGQKEAVRWALAAEDVAIIHGPPGTGKTTTLVEFIQQAVARGERVLACAPSHMGVDNLFAGLLESGLNVLRLGHPARVLPALRDQTLDMQVANHPDTGMAHNLRRGAMDLFRQADRYTRAKPAPGSKRAMRQEAREMLKEAQVLEQGVIERVIDAAEVVCSTLTGLESRFLGQRRFDWAVVDEAGQSLESACWIPLWYSDRLLLAGDHCQLPPVVIDRKAEKAGLGVSMMERLVAAGLPARRLERQYRMHEQIMTFSSRQFYDEGLVADGTVAGHVLTDWEGVEGEWLERPVRFIDTAGAGYDEELEEEGTSRFNVGEAGVVMKEVERLLACGVPAAAIGVIAPYSAQVRLLREGVEAEGVEVHSVDGFQGREKEVIIISLVRANVKGEVGFLEETRRMNVALTRARRHLVVIGDSATITAHPFYDALVAYFEEVEAYQSVWELGG